MFHKLLESNEPLNEAYTEIKRLNLLNGQLEMRMKGLMNERNAAVLQVKYLEKQIKDLKKDK